LQQFGCALPGLLLHFELQVAAVSANPHRQRSRPAESELPEVLRQPATYRGSGLERSMRREIA
jgi:hypothetical protein